MSQSSSQEGARYDGVIHRLVAWMSQTVFDRVTYTSRQGLTRGMKRVGGLGWLPTLGAPGPPSPEEQFWLTAPIDGLVIFDVGAFHGLLTLFFAPRARTVVAYEPNSRNRARLVKNLQANALSNVVVRDCGVGSAPGEATIVYSPLVPGAGSIDPDWGRSLRAREGDSREERIRVTTIDAEVEAGGLPVPDVIKIDIEGFELEALRGARQTLTRHRPALFLELHGATMDEKRRKVRDLVDYLDELGYGNVRHIESGTTVSRANCESVPEGHLYCTRGA